MLDGKDRDIQALETEKEELATQLELLKKLSIKHKKTIKKMKTKLSKDRDFDDDDYQFSSDDDSKQQSKSKTPTKSNNNPNTDRSKDTADKAVDTGESLFKKEDTD